MPPISIFFGIMIKMFFDDHEPAHFHAEYDDCELVVGVVPIKLLRGRAPQRMQSMVLEWAALHQEELLANWRRCKSMRAPKPIEPLE